jgi:phosphoribosylaminoimidazole carboxylase (NCAIR synthetase)
MILGGSQCQKNALIAARRMGYRTILADYLEHPPAAALADLHCRISTFDVGACLEAARRHRVDGIFTIGTDQPVYTAAQVAKSLGLPSQIGVDTALSVTNKLVMKPILTAHGIPTARYRFIAMDSPPDALCGLRPPYVLKPADSQGQRGVFKLPDTDAVFTALPEALSFSRQKEALTEEYYPSDELTLSAWVREGRLYPLALTDRLHYERSEERRVGTTRWRCRGVSSKPSAFKTAPYTSSF